jgi:hypothetical protein
MIVVNRVKILGANHPSPYGLVSMGNLTALPVRCCLVLACGGSNGICVCWDCFNNRGSMDVWEGHGPLITALLFKDGLYVERVHESENSVLLPFESLLVFGYTNCLGRSLFHVPSFGWPWPTFYPSFFWCDSQGFPFHP